MVGAVTGVRGPPTWTLYAALSAAESAFHCRLKRFSLSPLHSGGRRGRCTRQNMTYMFSYAFLAGGAVAEVGGAGLLGGTERIARGGAGTCPDGPIAEADATDSATQAPMPVSHSLCLGVAPRLLVPRGEVPAPSQPPNTAQDYPKLPVLPDL